MKLLLLNLSLLCLILQLCAAQRTYYVSSSTGFQNGSISIPNLPQSNPLSIIQYLRSGDKLLFCEGDVFHNVKMTINVPSVTLGSYVCNPNNAGKKPIITGSLKTSDFKLVPSSSIGYFDLSFNKLDTYLRDILI